MACCIFSQGDEKEIVVGEDDGIRPGVTPAALGGLKPVFKKGGTTTAGNSSQVCTHADHRRSATCIPQVWSSCAAIQKVWHIPWSRALDWGTMMPVLTLH